MSKHDLITHLKNKYNFIPVDENPGKRIKILLSNNVKSDMIRRFIK